MSDKHAEDTYVSDFLCLSYIIGFDSSIVIRLYSYRVPMMVESVLVYRSPFVFGRDVGWCGWVVWEGKWSRIWDVLSV